MLRTENLTLGYGGLPIAAGLDLDMPAGKITALVGPNGCGKSTLLRGLARLLKPLGGAVLLDGAAIHNLPTKVLARQIGILPQGPAAPEGITVRELVAQGRYPHQAWFQQWSEADECATSRALALTGLTPLAGRYMETLSGGQRQRAWIAMTLAQETRTLLLDEPTTFLDVAHQIDVLGLLERLNREEGRTIILVVHDLNLAARYAHHLIAMHAGRVKAAGPPAEIITPGLLREVFGIEADIVIDPRTGAPLCIPYALAAQPQVEAGPALNGNLHPNQTLAALV